MCGFWTPRCTGARTLAVIARAEELELRDCSAKLPAHRSLRLRVYRVKAFPVGWRWHYSTKSHLLNSCRCAPRLPSATSAEVRDLGFFGFVILELNTSFLALLFGRGPSFLKKISHRLLGRWFWELPSEASTKRLQAAVLS